MRRLPLFLLLILIALQWPLWNGYWALFQTRKAIEDQQKVNQELVYRNSALQADIRDLKQGNDAVQERARLQLGMVKADEVFVQVMDQPSALVAGPDQATVNTVPSTSQQDVVKNNKPVTASPMGSQSIPTTPNTVKP